MNLQVFWGVRCEISRSLPELCRQVIVQFLPERVVASIHVRFCNLIASAGTGMISECGPDLPLKNKDNLDPVLRLRRS